MRNDLHTVASQVAFGERLAVVVAVVGVVA